MRLFTYPVIYLILLITIGISQGSIYASGNNNCYVFDGSTGYASVRDGQPVTTDANQSGYQYFDNPSYSNNSITIEAWVYLLGENPGVKMPIVYRAFDDGYKTFSMYIQNRIAYVEIGNGIGQVSTAGQSPIPAFSWIHLAATYDGQTLKFYYGGTLVQTASVTLGSGHTSGSGGLYVAQSGEGTFKGLIDEIRIWKVALSANNINNSGGNGNPAENYPSSLAPYISGQWSFTEFTYFNGVKALKDLSPYNNHLRVYNVNDILDSKHLNLFVVNSTGDAPDPNPGDGTADIGNGQVTLRSAMMESNALAGNQKIYFYIPGNTPYNIQPGSPLPAVTDALSLDATTQSGYNGTPLIQVNGTYGNLTINSGGCTIQGLALNSTSGYALTLSANGGNVIKSNKIAGVSVASAGNNLYGNIIVNSISNGINITANNNTIGSTSGNDIHGNAGIGISFK
jgi:hypothetical protein